MTNKKSDLTIYEMINYWKRVTVDNIRDRDHDEDEISLEWAAQLATDIETIIMLGRGYQTEFEENDEEFFASEMVRAEGIKKLIQKESIDIREKLELILYMLLINIDA